MQYTDIQAYNYIWQKKNCNIRKYCIFLHRVWMIALMGIRQPINPNKSRKIKKSL